MTTIAELREMETRPNLVKQLRVGADYHEGEGDIGLPFILRAAADRIEALEASETEYEAELQHAEDCLDAANARTLVAETSRDKLAEAALAIVARCEALEDEASDGLAGLTVNDRAHTHEAGFWRGQKSTAKSIRNHLHDLTRAALSTLETPDA